MPKKCLIAHFHPVEKYPPCINMIEALVDADNEVVLVSSNCVDLTLRFSSKKNVRVERTTAYGVSPHLIKSVKAYVSFGSKVREELKQCEFQVCLIYEAVSFFLVHRRRWSSRIFVGLHYHEYRSKQETRAVSSFEKIADMWSSRNLMTANWISQASDLRSQAFSLEHNQDIRTLYNLPGFALRKVLRKRDSDPVKLVRLVLLGTVNFDRLVLIKIKELLKDFEEFELTLIGVEGANAPDAWKASRIHFVDRIEYSAIPSFLSEFDVGIIPYNGHSENMRLGLPNKFLEYQFSNLPVIYDSSMAGISQFRMTRASWNFCSVSVDFMVIEINELNVVLKNLSKSNWYGLDPTEVQDSRSEYQKFIKAAFQEAKSADN